MSDFINEIAAKAYKKELADTLKRFISIMPSYPEMNFFVKGVIAHYLSIFEKELPNIVVIGSGIPEELVYAAGKIPYWILGGSRISSMWADDAVPRDTDPVSRSTLGYIKSGFANKSLILVPLVSDSTRKLAYILKSMGLKVHTFHFPPVKEADSFQEWSRQYDVCRTAISRYIKKPLTKGALKKSEEKIMQAKEQIGSFIKASEGRISGTCRMLILESYYYTNDLSEWSRRLKLLTVRLQKEKRDNRKKGKKVLLFGSPVYFPNYKVPFLIEETGLEIGLQLDYSTFPLQVNRCQLQKADSMNVFYANDVSMAYVKNDSLYQKTAKMISEKEIDGVIYHVLKGQIEYDFELGRFEDLFEKMDIPVFRLETDYNYQDVEQLRIRLEAFSEVLDQKKYRKETVAI